MNRRNAPPVVTLLTLAIAAISAGGCSKSISDKNLVLVDPDEGMQLVEGRKRLLGIGGTETGAWVDPRTARQYRDGHIPGAIHMPFPKLNEDESELRAYDVLIVYGDDFKDDLADGMSKRLMEMGFDDVRTLRGGLKAWTRAGFDLEKGDPPPDKKP